MLLYALACTAIDADSAPPGGTADTAPDSAIDSAEVDPAIISVQWLSPVDGAEVSAGDVSCALIVEGFTMTSAAKHNDGAPEGYVRLTVDGSEAKLVASTNFSLPLDAGFHALGAQLYYGDGDAVYATHEAICDDADAEGCVGVSAEIEVNVGS